MSARIGIDVPDGAVGNWSVQSFEVNRDASRATRLRAALKGDRDLFVPAGHYKRLVCGEDVVMSNTPMEVRTNAAFIRAARGDVLIHGLGLGMVLKAILAKRSVRSVLVVEKHREVIELVGPTYHADPRVHIVHEDALEFTGLRGQRFDVAWHDIWTWISDENLPEMFRLHRRWGRRVGWQGSWCRDACEDMRAGAHRRLPVAWHGAQLVRP